MENKKVNFGWGITLMYYDENASNANFVRSTNASFSRRTGFRGHFGRASTAEKEKMMSLLERIAPKLVKSNLPQGAFVSVNFIKTADGLESSDLSSYILQSQVKDWMIENNSAFNFTQKTREKQDGTQDVWNITDRGLFSTSAGTLNLPSELANMSTKFELFLEIQFDKPTGYCVSC